MYFLDNFIVGLVILVVLLVRLGVLFIELDGNLLIVCIWDIEKFCFGYRESVWCILIKVNGYLLSMVVNIVVEIIIVVSIFVLM